VAPGNCDPALIWKAFTRGYHFSLYDHPFEQPQNESPAWQVARENIRLTRLLATRVQNMAQMAPREDLASTGYCLASEGQEYIIYSEKQAEFRVNGLGAGQEYLFEWINTARASVQETGRITAKEPTGRFQPPCEGAVLFLTRRRSGLKNITMPSSTFGAGM